MQSSTNRQPTLCLTLRIALLRVMQNKGRTQSIVVRPAGLFESQFASMLHIPLSWSEVLMGKSSSKSGVPERLILPSFPMHVQPCRIPEYKEVGIGIRDFWLDVIRPGQGFILRAVVLGPVVQFFPTGN